MQTAVVDGHRRNASPGLSGLCPGCGSLMIPKCGIRRVWHWAHLGERHCDPWWEETAWHVVWKNRFPPDWQEIARQAENGERHIADVMTPHSCAIEFQHSPIAPTERHARESFYGSMVWVVDGLVRKRDLGSFEATLRQSRKNPLIFFGDQADCALLADWVARPVDVFFDFGVPDEYPYLWHLHPNPAGRVILTRITVAEFVGRLLHGKAFRRVRVAPTPTKPTPAKPVVIHISVARPPSHPWRRRPESFQRYLRRKERSWRRF